MKVSFFPESKTGKWALGCFLVEVVMIIAFYLILTIFQVRGGDTFFSNPELFIPLLTGWFAGAVSFVMGCITIIKDKRKPLMIFVTTAIAFLTTLYGVMEIAFPH